MHGEPAGVSGQLLFVGAGRAERRGRILYVERKKRKPLTWSLVALSALAATFVGCRPPTNTPSAGNVPIIFVHGIYGSGDQYRAMGLYFGSNGYDQTRIKAFDYASLQNLGVGTGLDAFVDGVMREFNASKVQLVGHSLGTSVVNQYMGSHSNKVDKYVLVDGLGCGNTGRPCLAISEFSLPATGGGTQTHVESSVSPESFAKQYQFFLGKAPTTTKVVAEAPNAVKIAGRVQEFTANSPIANTPIEAWEVDQGTGLRVGNAPTAAGSTKADGTFGPLQIVGGKAYDITVKRAGGTTFHCYFQPFVRSDYLLRLNTIGPNSAAANASYQSDTAAAITVVRNREFWRNKGRQNDELSLTNADGSTVDVFKNVTGNVVGVWIQDNAASPGRTTNDKLAYFGNQPFQTGVDIFMPASSPPDGTISLVNTPRGDASKKQTLNVANWASKTDAVLAEFNDWV
jgi:pimeloyl-ACP methyl ester carboxylesterase